MLHDLSENSCHSSVNGQKIHDQEMIFMRRTLVWGLACGLLYELLKDTNHTLLLRRRILGEASCGISLKT